MHKLARGLLPVTTRSAHAIADHDFARAIERFTIDEGAEVAHAVEELEGASPFKSSPEAGRHRRIDIAPQPMNGEPQP